MRMHHFRLRGSVVRHVIIWGGTGQAKVLREALAEGTKVVAVFDSREVAPPFSDVPLFHGESGFNDWKMRCQGEHQLGACIAVGGTRGVERLQLQRWLADNGYPPLTVVHRRAFVAADAALGLGCQILAMAAVCSAARLGDAVIINTSASIDHDCVIGNGVHVAPGARLAGEVTVGNYAFIGTGAVVLPRVHIGDGAIVGAGAVVTRDVPKSTTVAGNPARPTQQPR